MKLTWSCLTAAGLVCSTGAFARTGAIECFDKSYNTSLRSNDALRVKLCAGALSVAPVSCFEESYNLSEIRGNDDLRVKLCASARNLEPITCFDESYNTSLRSNVDLRVELCASHT